MQIRYLGAADCICHFDFVVMLPPLKRVDRMNVKSTEDIQIILERAINTVELNVKKPSIKLKRQYHKAELALAEAAFEFDILNDMKEHLVQKNVGHEVANDLSESVKVALVGKKLGTFGQVKVTVREAFEEELGRILTPKKSTDIVQNIRKSQAQGKPFSIVFIL